MKTAIVCLFVKVLLFQSLIGQETVFVEGAKGMGIIAGSVTERDARREALDEAKVEALRKAGISEHIQSYEMLYRSEVERDYSEFYSSDIQAELQGQVINVEIVDMQRLADPLLAIEKTINAEVIIHETRPDPAFNVNIEGIKGVYESGEKLEFNVTSTMDCYLNIFNVTDDETLLMYPNQWEELKKIPKGKNVSFPLGVADYWLEKSGNEPEMNRLIFVFTKEPVQFLNFEGEYQFTTQNDMNTWVYSLPPDIRRVEYQAFTIR